MFARFFTIFLQFLYLFDFFFTCSKSNRKSYKCIKLKTYRNYVKLLFIKLKEDVKIKNNFIYINNFISNNS